MVKKAAAVLLLACAVSGQWAQPGGSEVARQFQSQDGYGQAKYGYSHPGQAAETHRDARGNQVGSYAYISPEGREIRINFIADSNGYRVDNDYTQDTPEVAAARSEHLAAHAAALAAAKAASPNQEAWDAPQSVKSKPVVVPQQVSWTTPQQKTWVAPPASNWAPVQAQYGLPQPVQDTPEVQAAKAEFFQTFNVAAARAPKEQNAIAPAKKIWTAPEQKSWAAPVQNKWVVPTSWAPVQVQYGLPKPVQDTPEVQAAKAEFFNSFREAAARAPAQDNFVAPQEKTWTAPQPATWVAPQQNTWAAPQPIVLDQYGLPQQVEDTPDVQAARAQFFRAFKAAAKAAASASAAAAQKSAQQENYY